MSRSDQYQMSSIWRRTAYRLATVGRIHGAVVSYGAGVAPFNGMSPTDSDLNPKLPDQDHLNRHHTGETGRQIVMPASRNAPRSLAIPADDQHHRSDGWWAAVAMHQGSTQFPEAASACVC